MNFELRLKGLRKKWLEIQELREEQHKARILARSYAKKVRKIGQELPKMLNEYNEMMV